MSYYATAAVYREVHCSKCNELFDDELTEWDKCPDCVEQEELEANIDDLAKMVADEDEGDVVRALAAYELVLKQCELKRLVLKARE